MAEETGLIVPIGEWVIRRACAEAATWPRDLDGRGEPLVRSQFSGRDLVNVVFSALAAVAVCRASRLELEITESVLLKNNESDARDAAPAARFRRAHLDG